MILARALDLLVVYYFAQEINYGKIASDSRSLCKYCINFRQRS